MPLYPSKRLDTRQNLNVHNLLINRRLEDSVGEFRIYLLVCKLHSSSIQSSFSRFYPSVAAVEQINARSNDMFTLLARIEASIKGKQVNELFDDISDLLTRVIESPYESQGTSSSQDIDSNLPFYTLLEL